MALTLVKETGAVVTGANSYADSADGDAYHEGHAYASAWTAATTEQKEAALVMATRLIDAYMQFGGGRVSDGQALQWPRYGCPDWDAGEAVNPLRAWTGGLACFDSTKIPAVLVAATCEEARCLLVEDLSAAPAGEGLKSSQIGTMRTVFDATRSPHVLSRVTRRLLSKLGTCLGDSGGVRLTRV